MKNRYKNTYLDEEEREIEEALERGDYKSVPRKEFEHLRQMLVEASKNHVELKKTKPITIRINQADLIMIKAKASKKNMPYQTLIGDILRKYVGR